MTQHITKSCHKVYSSLKLDGMSTIVGLHDVISKNNLEVVAELRMFSRNQIDNN